MEGNKQNRPRSIGKEKLWLALIPVIGAITVAAIPIIQHLLGPHETKTTIDLKEEAKRVNKMIIYSDYNELYPLLTEQYQMYLTPELFRHTNDSLNTILGKFFETISITQSKNPQGLDECSVKNQYQNGQSLITIIFDNQGKIPLINREDKAQK